MPDDFDASFFDPQAAIDLIRAQVPDFVLVSGARDLGNARIETLRTPTAWVIANAETPEPVKYDFPEVIDQRVTTRFGVVIAVRDIGDRTGERAREALRPLRVALHRAICRWTPVGASHACRFAGGAMTSSIGQDGLLLWQDDFSVAYDRRLEV